MSNSRTLWVFVVATITVGCSSNPKPTRPKPVPEPEPAQSIAALTSEQLQELEQTVRAGLPGLVNCYENGLENRSNKSLQGKVVFKFLINPDGSATEVEVGQSELGVESVHQCMITAIKGWEFPNVKEPMWYSRAVTFSPAY